MTHTRTLSAAAGSLIVAGFPGEILPSFLARALARSQLAGVILFRPNLVSVHQVVQLTASVQKAVEDPFEKALIAVDEEGGKVSRLGHLITGLPAMRGLGHIDDSDLTRRAGHMVGTELMALGINTNLAPICDVDTRPDNPIIADRAFSDDPACVKRQAQAFIHGLGEAGVLACAKHFPGHGDTEVDSHRDLPVVAHDRDRLQRVEWIPFVGAIEAGVPLVMSAHLLLPALDPTHPATLSRTLLTDGLRHELGFEGAIISDDLEMAALADRYPAEDRVALGLLAGVDLFLFCHSPDLPELALETLVHLAERSPAARDLVLAAAHRVGQLRRRLARPPDPTVSLGRIRCREHLDLRDEIDRRIDAGPS